MAKKMAIHEVEPGMMIAEPVTNINHKVLLFPGTKLTRSLIALLSGPWNVLSVIIAEPGDNIRPLPVQSVRRIQAPAPTLENLPTIPRKNLPYSAIRKLFFNNYAGTADRINQLFEAYLTTKKLPFLELRDTATMVYHSLVETSGSMHFLLLQDHQGAYLPQHSLAVAVVSGIIGKWLEMNPADIKQVVFAALLHDIGKTMLPLSLQSGKNLTTDTEKELYRMHPGRGAEILSPLKGVPRDIILAVEQHHEHLDGTGFPQKLAGDSIHLYARIIALADTFHTLGGDSEHPNPFDISARLQQDLNEKLDPALCDLFARRLSDYLFTNDVLLSDGNQAEVIFLPHTESNKPVVRTKDGDFIDLRRRKGISITGIIKKPDRT